MWLLCCQPQCGRCQGHRGSPSRSNVLACRPTAACWSSWSWWGGDADVPAQVSRAPWTLSKVQSEADKPSRNKTALQRRTSTETLRNRKAPFLSSPEVLEIFLPRLGKSWLAGVLRGSKVSTAIGVFWLLLLLLLCPTRSGAIIYDVWHRLPEYHCLLIIIIIIIIFVQCMTCQPQSITKQNIYNSPTITRETNKKDLKYNCRPVYPNNTLLLLEDILRHYCLFVIYIPATLQRDRDPVTAALYEFLFHYNYLLL